jgi:thiamine pyrophosphokinase
MRAFLYTGGEIYPEGITEQPKEGDLIIAADAGYQNALALGVRPDILLGDFDSLKLSELPKDLTVLRVPAEKDFTDTQMGVEEALTRGASELVIIGGLGGRIDHELSNLAILEYLSQRKIPAILTNGKCRARFLRNGSTLLPRAPHFRYLSLIAADPTVRGVSLEGCKYPLQNAKLNRLNQYAVSNEITENCALVSVKRGGVWIIESAD